MQRLILSIALVVGCTSESKTPVDAAAGKMDAPKVDAPKLDAPKLDAAQVCTGMIYDACNPASSNCQGSTTCKTFTGSGFSVCTPTCDGANPCPNQNGNPVTCNGMGICKPSAPNSNCTAP
jgi:hypothetical protein